jgi:hypothetical protein
MRRVVSGAKHALPSSTHPIEHPLHTILPHALSAEDSWGTWLIPALVWAGFYTVALDFPGCGESKEFKDNKLVHKLKTRSQFNLQARLDTHTRIHVKAVR